MGKINQGILDGVSGKVGNVIGASWKGIDYIRVKPSSVANPRTPRQMQQRTRFKGVTSTAKQLLDSIVRPIWNKAAVKMSGYNLFVKRNMEAFGPDGTIIDFSKLQMSAGKLPNPYQISVEKTEGVESGVSISWDELSEEDFGGNSLMLVAFDQDGQEIFTDLTGDILRGEGGTDIVLPFDPGTEAHMYIFFTDVERKTFSDSVYFAVNL